MSGFNAAALAAPVANVRIAGPEPMPAALNSILNHRSRFINQFLKPDLDFEIDDGIDAATVQNYLTVLRNSICPAEQLVGTTAATMSYYFNHVWIIPDTRGVRSNPATNPITAGVPNISRLIIFWLRPVRIDASTNSWIGNTSWQAVLLANHFPAPTADLPLIAVPKIMLLSEAQMLKGFLAFEAYRESFNVVYPDNATFCQNDRFRIAHQPNSM